MEVILREDVPQLGVIGDVVKVKAGYARNYLLPKGKAVTADRRSLRSLEHEKALIQLKKENEMGDVDTRQKAFDGVAVEIEARAAKSGHLFGSVTASDVSRLLEERGLVINKHDVQLVTPIKEAGTHEVPVHVGHGVVANIKVSVIAIGGGEDDAGEEGAVPEEAVVDELSAATDEVETTSSGSDEDSVDSESVEEVAEGDSSESTDADEEEPQA
ncbi:MAG TPA: 50S ribosomal protein L9 [candidate division UBP10 bacterium]|nr:50S ribosomal protein L9 [Candidatus Binatota bacterium]